MRRSSGSRSRTVRPKITAWLAEKSAGTGRSDQLVIGIQRNTPQILSCNPANHGIAQITVHPKEALGAAPFSKLESGRAAGPLGRNVKRDALTRGYRTCTKLLSDGTMRPPIRVKPADAKSGGLISLPNRFDIQAFK